MQARAFILAILFVMFVSGGGNISTADGHSRSSNGAARPAKLEGMAYQTARKIILSYGWKPWFGHCEADPGTCAKYPEVDVCSASFPISCGMRFVRRGWCLGVGTEGEAPPGVAAGQPIVTGVTFRRTSCQKLFQPR